MERTCPEQGRRIRYLAEFLASGMCGKRRVAGGRGGWRDERRGQTGRLAATLRAQARRAKLEYVAYEETRAYATAIGVLLYETPTPKNTIFAPGCSK